MHKEQPIEIALIKLAWVASQVVGCPKSTKIKGNTHHTNCIRQAHGHMFETFVAQPTSNKNRRLCLSYTKFCNLLEGKTETKMARTAIC